MHFKLMPAQCPATVPWKMVQNLIKVTETTILGLSISFFYFLFYFSISKTNRNAKTKNIDTYHMKGNLLEKIVVAFCVGKLQRLYYYL